MSKSLQHRDARAMFWSVVGSRRARVEVRPDELQFGRVPSLIPGCSRGARSGPGVHSVAIVGPIPGLRGRRRRGVPIFSRWSASVGVGSSAWPGHRNLVRRRVTPYDVRGDGPPPGTKVIASKIEIAVAGSRCGDESLALIRLDELADARAVGTAPTARGASLDLVVVRAAN